MISRNNRLVEWKPEVVVVIIVVVVVVVVVIVVAVTIFLSTSKLI